MRLSKEDFIQEVENIVTMIRQVNLLVDALGSSTDTVFDDWISNYYNLLSTCCDFKEEECLGWDGSPLDFYIFTIAQIDEPFRLYTNYKDEEIDLSTPEQLYDYIISSH